jgi:hypothetical protein
MSHGHEMSRSGGCLSPKPDNPVTFRFLVKELWKMSQSSGRRPWHGSPEPFEAIFAHFTAEIAALRAELAKVVDPRSDSPRHDEATKPVPPATPSIAAPVKPVVSPLSSAARSADDPKPAA